MRICLFVDRSRILRWHAWLAESIADLRDCELSLAFARTTIPLPRACASVFEVERLIYGLGRNGAMDRIGVSELAARCNAKAAADLAFDILIDVAGLERPFPACRRLLRPLFNSVPSELGAISSLLDDRAVRIAILDSADPAGPLHAQPAITDRLVLTKALDNIFSCATELILKTLSGVPIQSAADDVRHVGISDRPPAIPCAADVLVRVAAVLAWKLWDYLGRIITGGRSWAVAWRLNESSSLIQDGKVLLSILPDDRRRYYADPFSYYDGGRHHLFVEEYQFATQRGCISVATIESDGSVSTPRVIIDEAYHLSFPFVFKHGGEIWMIPESGAANRIDLYRATAFPYRWKREGALLDGVSGYDATLFRQNDRLWIFACVGRWRTSTWDNLCLFHARHLLDRWSPYPMNPVLLDATVSRPAGALFKRSGKTFRPAQDCSRIYGGAISVCRVDRLSESGFCQTVTGRIEADALGCHTYNRRSGLEVLDVFGAAHRSKTVTAYYKTNPPEPLEELAS
jgi:hypothetical protein